MKNFWKFSMLSMGLMLSASPLYAQLFNAYSDSEARQEENNQSSKSSYNKSNVKEQKSEATNDTFADDLGMTEEEKQEVMKRLKEQLNPRIKDGNLVVNPVDLGPTDDGSKRGSTAFISINSDKEEDDGNIFLYYSNFKMRRTLATGLGCQVRFHILNGLNKRVSNLSVKLVWPGLNTPLSFDNINPNTENYFDYALFGEGCYQMDKIPNIVVNRCRVKGMSQEGCANRIRWLSKQ